MELPSVWWPQSCTQYMCVRNPYVIVDKGIEALGKVTLLIKVKTLTLSELKGVTGEGIKNVGSRSITELNLSDCNKLGDEGVINIVQRCVNVEVLNLSSVYKLTDNAVVCVAETLGETLVNYNILLCTDNN